MEIKLNKNDKQYIDGTNDVFEIMRRILLREDPIDQDKEHFWIIGMNASGLILYIELISLGTVRSVPVEPMNVYRVAVMKNATRVIAIHNHPGGNMVASEEDKDITDRLIQVGKILNIEFLDHLIISPLAYISFKAIGLMDELEKSLKYVPTYQIIEKIRKEEKKIAKEKLAVEKSKTQNALDKVNAAKDKLKAAKEKERAAKQAEKEVKEKLASAIQFLQEKNIPTEQIANILEIDLAELKKILKKNKI